MCQAYFKRCVVTLRTTYEPMVRLFYKIESVAILTHSNYQLEFSTTKKPMRVSWPLPTRNTFTPQYSTQLHRTIPDYFTLNQITNICTFTLHRKLNYLLHIHGVHILHVTIHYTVIKSHNTTHENRTPKHLACFQ